MIPPVAVRRIEIPDEKMWGKGKDRYWFAERAEFEFKISPRCLRSQFPSSARRGQPGRAERAVEFVGAGWRDE